MNKEDYYFYVKWEDLKGIEHKVAVLVRIDGVYYLKYNINSLNNNGFVGIPSFKQYTTLYKSKNELFEFFQKRILKPETNKNSFDEMEALAKNFGKTQTDSFSVEVIAENDIEKVKNIIKKLDEIQQETSNQL